MANVNVLSTERLKALIADTEGTLKQLTIELERRELLKQENAIENLEEHMKDAELSLDTIRQFLAYLANDLKNRE
ncbi:hypothetical protein [uncultured Paraglaciecola sp.]|uniref:hypothetical protein n=1 Tax=uncultured Paraglaciecola sp. TaxID=1765024 RepID=UPI002597FA1B|nr:hypothetical protein [uncultured Paraglaciecola sp.]